MVLLSRCDSTVLWEVSVQIPALAGEADVVMDPFALLITSSYWLLVALWGVILGIYFRHLWRGHLREAVSAAGAVGSRGAVPIQGPRVRAEGPRNVTSLSVSSRSIQMEVTEAASHLSQSRGIR